MEKERIKAAMAMVDGAKSIEVVSVNTGEKEIKVGYTKIKVGDQEIIIYLPKSRRLSCQRF
jgi:copper chaperone CopZ